MGRTTFFLLLIGVPIAVVTFIVWKVRVPHTADLLPEKAAEVISASPEFNRWRSMVNVSATNRCVDSLKDTCYNAEFTFTEHGSSTPVKSEAEFRYWDHLWHLNEFHYGQPPNVDTVYITSDRQP